MDKGGVLIGDTLLFGKYHLHRVLGTGRSGTVFLATHRELEEYRAIKRVPKSFTDYRRFRQEALILKTIRHPGIPIVYDVEEDEDYSYLIEEYLEGESLFNLVSRLGHLTKAMTVRYGLQICHLVCTLHSAAPNPILYLDLQPKNLLLCHETVKLVDFDHALPLGQANSDRFRYGTRGWAAPEQYVAGAALDERTDIYAIGSTLYYLLTGAPPDSGCQMPPDLGRQPPPTQFQRRRDLRAVCGRDLGRILGRCLEADPGRRYAGVADLARDLSKLQEREAGVFSEQSLSSLRLAVAGSRAGIGTTHLAIGLSGFLGRNGYPSLYEEHNRSQAVSALARAFGASRDRLGLVRIRGGAFKPYYGEAVTLGEPPYGRVIMDFGTDWDGAAKAGADGTILVCDGKWWSAEQNLRAAQAFCGHGKLCLAYSHCCPSARVGRPAGIPAGDCFLVPHHPDPFETGPESDACYKAILRRLTEGRDWACPAGRGRRWWAKALRGLRRP